MGPNNKYYYPWSIHKKLSLFCGHLNYSTLYMKFVITPYGNIVFWLKTGVCASFYFLGLSFLFVPNGIGPAIVVLAISFGLSVLLLRDRVFTFEANSLRISSALNFYPFNRIFKTYTYNFNEIHYIKLSFVEGIRYWGIAFSLELIKTKLTAEDVANNLEQKLKEIAKQSKVFFIAFALKSKIDLWADKIEPFGIKTVRKK